MDEHKDSQVNGGGPTVTEVAVGSSATMTKPRSFVRWYILTGVVVLLIVVGVWFILERDGRLHTGVFDGLVSGLEKQQAAAVVNGVEISVFDFNATLRQLTANVEQQGGDIADPTIADEVRTQAMDSLVNTEVLRQKAVENNGVATEEDINARYEQIAESLGGVETLLSRMGELGVSEEMLRRDIKNDILIQAHLESAVDLSSATVSDEEIQAFYTQATASMEDAPPLAEVRDQIEQQIRFGKEQELVAAYVTSLREVASVEIKM